LSRLAVVAVLCVCYLDSTGAFNLDAELVSLGDERKEWPALRAFDIEGRHL
jgi:hypothetical protein